VNLSPSFFRDFSKQNHFEIDGTRIAKVKGVTEKLRGG
jgi:hypothetical protein